MDNSMITPRAVTAEQAEELQRAFIVKVYGWMMQGSCSQASCRF